MAGKEKPQKRQQRVRMVIGKVVLEGRAGRV
jgi:hypothetical protein